MGQSHLLKTLTPVGMAMLGAITSLGIAPIKAQAQSAEAFAGSGALYFVDIETSISGLTFDTSASSSALVDPGFADDDTATGTGDFIDVLSDVDLSNGLAISGAAIEFNVINSLLLADNFAVAEALAPPDTTAQSFGAWTAVSSAFTAIDDDFLDLEIIIDYGLAVGVDGSRSADADIQFDIFLDPVGPGADISLYTFDDMLSLSGSGFEEIEDDFFVEVLTDFGTDVGEVAPGNYSLVLAAVESASVAAVPEPLTLLGASAAVAFGAAFKRRKS